MNQSLRYKINTPHIVHEIFDDHEAAIINLKSGNYYSLDPVGAFVWAHIESGATVGEVVEEVLGRYEASPAEVSREVGRFLQTLEQEELIVRYSDTVPKPDGRRVKIGIDGNGEKIAFTLPVIERYNDMQELLLLDPIHEVDDTGWPNRKQED